MDRMCILAGTETAEMSHLPKYKPSVQLALIAFGGQFIVEIFPAAWPKSAPSLALGVSAAMLGINSMSARGRALS
jgi:hypothetical protein